MTMTTSNKILGIDPGLRITGYACVKSPGNHRSCLLEAGILRLDSSKDIPDRLVDLRKDLEQIIDNLKPNILAVEQVFSHPKHVRTALVMAHARGVIIECGRQHDLKIEELTPTTVKRAIAGTGHASKLQIQESIKNQFELPKLPTPTDLADAIAIAACAAHRSHTISD